MKIKNLVLFLSIGLVFCSCKTAGRLSITTPSSQTVLSNFTALSASVVSLTTAPATTMVPYADKAPGYAQLELTVANYTALDSLRPNHHQIIVTDLILQKNIIQFELEHKNAGSINGYKLGLSGILINDIIKQRIVQEQTFFNVKQ